MRRSHLKEIMKAGVLYLRELDRRRMLNEASFDEARGIQRTTDKSPDELADIGAAFVRTLECPQEHGRERFVILPDCFEVER